MRRIKEILAFVFFLAGTIAFVFGIVFAVNSWNLIPLILFVPARIFYYIAEKLYDSL